MRRLPCNELLLGQSCAAGETSKCGSRGRVNWCGEQLKVLESTLFLSLCFVPVINWMEAVRLYEETGDNAGSLNLGKIKLIYLVQELPGASAALLFRGRSRAGCGVPVSSLCSLSPACSSLRGGGPGSGGPQLPRALWPQVGPSLSLPVGAGMRTALPLLGGVGGSRRR